MTNNNNDRQQPPLPPSSSSSPSASQTGAAPASASSSSASVPSSSHAPASQTPQSRVSYSLSSHLRSLLNALTPASYAATLAELQSLLALHGDDACWCLLLTATQLLTQDAASSPLSSSSSSPAFSSPKPDSQEHKEAASSSSSSSSLSPAPALAQYQELRAQLLRDCLRDGSDRESFPILLSAALEQQLGSRSDAAHDAPLAAERFMRRLRLRAAWGLVVPLLLTASSNAAVSREGARMLRSRVEEIVGVALDSAATVEAVLRTLLSFLSSSPSSSAAQSISAHQRRAVLLAIRHIDPSLSAFPSLAPLLPVLSADSAEVSAASSSSSLSSSLLSSSVDPSLSSHRLSCLLRDLGYSCMRSVSGFSEVLAMYGSVNEHDVAMMVCLMLRTVESLSPSAASLSLPRILSLPASAVLSPPPAVSWSASTFIATVFSLHPHLSWRLVLSHLDHPAFLLPSPHSLSLLLSLHQHATNAQQFPLSLFLSPHWKHERGRLSLMRWACPLRWQMFAMHVMPTQGRAQDEEAERGGQDAGGSSVLHGGDGVRYEWWAMDLLQALLQVKATALHQQLSELLTAASASASPLLAAITHGDRLHVPVALTLFPTSATQPLLQPILDGSPQLLTPVLQSVLLHTPAFLSSLISSSQSLLRLLSLPDAAYRDEMLHACTNRGQYQLQQFLSLCLKDPASSSLAVSSALQLLDSELQSLSVSHLSVFFRQLYGGMQGLSGEQQQRLEAAYRRATSVYSSLPEYLLSSDDIESSSLSYYQQLYSRSLPLPSFLALLSTLRSSPSPRDKEVYAAIVHTLFAEFPHLPSYPLPHLQLASVLFGCLIASFLSSLLRALALKLVLSSVSSPQRKHRQFAVWALQQCRQRMVEWPQYCRLLMEAGGWLKDAEPQLWRSLQSAVDGEEAVGGGEEEADGSSSSAAEKLERQLVPAMKTGWLGVVETARGGLDREAGMLALSVGGDESAVRDDGWMRDELELEDEHEAAAAAASARADVLTSRFLPALAASSPRASVAASNASSPPAFAFAPIPSSAGVDVHSSSDSYSRTQSGIADNANGYAPAANGGSTDGYGGGAAGGDGTAGSNGQQGDRGMARDTLSPSPPPPSDRSPAPPSPSPPPGLFNIKPAPLASATTAAMPSSSSSSAAAAFPSAAASSAAASVNSALSVGPSSQSGALSTGPSTPSRSASSAAPPTFGSTLNIDSLLSAQRDATRPLPLAPSESIKDKIAFIINNVSAANLRSKGRELRLLLRPEHYAYFSRYLVIQRVSIEANFQRLYGQLLEAVDVPELQRQTVDCTYDNIKVLLQSDKVLSSSSERSLLKNLGSWLGLLTIAKNRPIRSKHLDLKQLVLDAFDSGRLIAVIPFCAKVLESCAESRVFRLPNPWLMGCASLLKEIFDIPGLKLNLKFEIEVLFRTLGIVMKDVRASSLLRERNITSDFTAAAAAAGQQQQTQPQGAAAMARGAAVGSNGVGAAGLGKGKRPSSPSSFTEEGDEGSDALPGIPRSTTPGGSLLPPSASAAQQQQQQQQFPADAAMIVPNLPSYVNINPSIPLFSMFSHLKRTVPAAIDRAIKEIINPVVERSVTIACVTTRELIVKDFAMESDEQRVRAAAHSMVQNLTSSLALVTCKEPLRVSITNHLGSLLEANAANAADPSIKAAIEAACAQVSNDNLELGCTLIEKAAAERAIREIDEALAGVYAIRRKAREAGGTYVDMSVFSSGRFPASLPEVLRARSSGLTAPQLRVYDDFGRIRQHYQAVVAAPPAVSERQSQGKEGAAAGTAAGMPVGAGGGAAGSSAAAAMQEAEMKRRLTGRASPVSVPAQIPGAGLRLPNALPSNLNSRSPPLDPSLASASSASSSLTALTSAQTLDKLVAYLAQLEQAVLRFPNHKSIPLHSLTQPQLSASSPQMRDDHEIQLSLRLISSLLSQPLRDEATYPREIVALTFAHKVFKRLYDRENRTSLLQIDVHTQVLKCFPEADTRVLTDAGLRFLHEIEDRQQRGERVLFACLDVGSQSIVYRPGTLVYPEPPTELIEFSSEGEAARWAAESDDCGADDGSDSDAHLSLRVTPDHDMYVQLGNADVTKDRSTARPPLKMRAASLLSLCQCQQTECEHRRATLRMQACAERGHLGSADTAERDAVQRRLGLSESQFLVFLQLLGFFLGSGRLQYGKGGCEAAAFAPRKQTDRDWLLTQIAAVGLPHCTSPVRGAQAVIVDDHRWLSYFEQEFGHKSQQQRDEALSADTGDSVLLVQRFPRWLLLQLTSDELRLVIAGLWRAEGECAARDGVKRICTSSVEFREQLVQALLHCGCSPLASLAYTRGAVQGYRPCEQTVDLAVCSLGEYSSLGPAARSGFIPVMATADVWAVSWAEPGSGASKAVCWPSMLRQSCVTSHAYSAERDGRIWCVTVDHPDHLIFAQRAERSGAAGAVSRQSRAVVVGQCIRVVCPKVVTQLTEWLLFGDDDRKFIIPITVALLRGRLLASPEVDAFLNKLVQALQSTQQAVQTVPNPAAATSPSAPPTIQVLHQHLDFVFALIRRVVIKRPILQAMELKLTLESLNALAHTSRHKLLQETIGHLLDDVRAAALSAEGGGQLVAAVDRAAAEMKEADTKPGPQYGEEEGAMMAGGVSDSVEREEEADGGALRTAVMYLLDEWMTICLQGSASDKAYSAYLSLLHQQRVIATPDSTSRFFKALIMLSVEHATQSEQAVSYTAVDAVVKLFIFLLKFLDAPPPSLQQQQSGAANKIRLLSAFLTATASVLRRDFALHKQAFNQRPYLRLLNHLLHDLNSPDPLFDSNNVDVLLSFGQCFSLLSPSRVPAFVFAWLELISHRMFMSKVLISKQPSCSLLFARLLTDLFRFQQPFLRTAELTDSVKLAYKATLRILLVLLHDFPEFLCDFHFSFCDVIPPSCIQMRNLILSAFPRNMRLPDPFTPNLKVDLLPEIAVPPRIVSDVLSSLSVFRQQLQLPLELYLKTRDNSGGFLKSVPPLLSLHALPGLQAHEVQHLVKRAGTSYNVPLINSLILYVGTHGVATQQKAQQQQQAGGGSGGSSPPAASFPDHACMDVFESLLSSLDAEGRYYCLNAIANQLRYPNQHTHYFSMCLLYLFLHSRADSHTAEQITRVLLERLIVHRPHPWGLLITFIELIKNPRYSFWEQQFTRCAPEIERLFESVARSCMPGGAGAGGGGGAGGGRGAGAEGGGSGGGGGGDGSGEGN